MSQQILNLCRGWGTKGSLSPARIHECPLKTLVFSFAFCLCFAVVPKSVLAQAAPGKFALKAESPQFWTLIPQDAALEKVASGFGFTEGPVWDTKGFLYVSD